MNPLTREIVLITLQVVAALTGVVLIAAVVARCLPTRFPVVRERLWHAALIGVLASPLVPIISRWMPDRAPALEILPAAAYTTASPGAVLNFDSQSVDSPVHASVTHASEPPSVVIDGSAALRISPDESGSVTQPRTTTYQPTAITLPPATIQPGARPLPVPAGVILLLVLWVAGIVYFGIRGSIGWHRCRRIVASALPLEAGRFTAERACARAALDLERFPEIVVSGAIGSPAVVGIVQPRIVLPGQSLDWISAPQMTQVLVHEAAHIVRGDPLINLLQQLARALFWPHPLVHWLNRRLSEAREDVCDNFVLSRCEPADYAETLLTIAERLAPRRLPAPGLAMLPVAGILERRIASLLDDRRDTSIHLSRWRSLALQATLLLVPIAMAAVRLTDRPIQAADPAPATSAAKVKNEEKKPIDEKKEPRPAAAPVTLSGEVRSDKDGQTVEGADVTLLLPAPPGQDYYIWPLPVQHIKSDAQGRYSFFGLKPGKYRVWANHERFTSRRTNLSGTVVVIPETGDPPKPVQLRMFPGVAVTARINDKSSGKPLPKALVILGWSDLKQDNFATDEKGEVLLQPLTAERWYIETWAEGYGRQSQWLNLESGSDAEVEFALGPGGDLEGVVHASGKPVADVGLSVHIHGVSMQLVYVKSDSQGHYRLPSLPFDVDLEVSLSKQDFARKTVPVRMTRPKQALDFEISPRPYGGSIAGVVQDERGRPIAGAELVNFGNSTSEECKTTTDKAGRFRLGKLFKNSVGYEIVVRAKKFAPHRLSVEPGPADKPTDLTITLDPGHSISGRVVDEAARPLADVTVYFAQGNHAFSNGGKTITDKQGRFEFDSLPEHSPFSFFKQGFSDINERQLPLDGKSVIEVEMIPSGIIAGKVLDAKSGKPIRAFNLRINFSPQQPGDPSATLSSDLINPGQAFQVNQGTFQLKDLLVGMPLQVTVDAAGYERGIQERVVAARPADVEPVEFRLEPIDPARLSAYAGRLVDAAQKPVVGAQLRLIAARERKAGARHAYPFNMQMIQTGQLAQQPSVLRFLEAASDKEGRFEFPGIPKDAEVELVWWGKGIAPGRADHLEALREEERTRIQLDLPPPALVKGEIDRKKFPKVGSLWICEKDDPGAGEHIDLRDDQKTFEVGGLAPGTYRIQLMAPYERAASSTGGLTSRPLAHTEFTVKVGESAVVNFGGE